MEEVLGRITQNYNQVTSLDLIPLAQSKDTLDRNIFPLAQLLTT
jgi:hypothetical protein